jgi:GH25 family lysozyme M1 (1,4-beta-N-acetylmuramidase)
MTTAALPIAPPSAMRVPGLDIYHPSPIGPPLTFFRLARDHGIGFVTIKATEGDKRTASALLSPSYHERRDAARVAGLHVGPYHFAHPDGRARDAIGEARLFVGHAGKWQSGDLPPALDFEDSEGYAGTMTTTARIAWAAACLQEIEQLCGVRPMLYTYKAYWQSQLGRTLAFAGYPLWWAEYNGLTLPSVVTGWPWTIWQTTGHGRLPWALGAGGKANWDLDVFSGDAMALARFCGSCELPDPVV